MPLEATDSGRTANVDPRHPAGGEGHQDLELPETSR